MTPVLYTNDCHTDTALRNSIYRLRFAELRAWEIHEYDGREWVAEKHRTWS